MNLLISKIPSLAKETQLKVVKAIDNIKNEDSTYFYSENLQKDKIEQLLQSKYIQENQDALKRIMALHVLGKDISPYIPKIIQTLAKDSSTVKRICHYLLLELKCIKQSEADNVLMCISPLHREILSPKILQRGEALKTLSSINMQEIYTILMATMNKVVIDRSAYVRKIATYGLYKIFQGSRGYTQGGLSDIIDIEQVEHFLKYLFKDSHYNRGAALSIFYQLNLDPKLQFMHKLFRQLCKELYKYNPHDLVIILDILYQYALMYLNPQYLAKEEKNQNLEQKNILEQNNQEQNNQEQNNQEQNAQEGQKQKDKQKKKNKAQIEIKQQTDLQLLLESCEKLLRYPSPAVVVQLSYIFLEFGSQKQLSKLTSTLIKFMNMSSETKFVILQIIEKIAKAYPDLVKDKFSSLLIINLEKNYCKLKKIQIHYYLVDEYNFNKIIDEITYQTKSTNDEVVSLSIQTIGKIALKNKKYLGKCTKILLNILKQKPYSSKMDEAIMSLSQIIINNLDANLPILAYCLKIVPLIDNPKPKSNLISLLSIIQEKVPTLSLNFFQQLVPTFKTQCQDMKLQILNFGFTLFVNNKNESLIQPILLNYLFILNLSIYDQDILVRDKARYLKNMMITMSCKNKEKQEELNQNIYLFSPDDYLSFLSAISEKSYKFDHFFELAISSSNQSNKHNSDPNDSQFKIGYISNLIGYKLSNTKLSPSDNDIFKVDTSHLREIAQEDEAILGQQKNDQDQQVQEQSQKQQQQSVIQSDQPQKQEIKQDQQIAQHYDNLEEVLDDFFSSDEEEDDDDNKK